MNAGALIRFLISLTLVAAMTPGHGGVVFEADSAYHHIRVVDRGGVRLLMFNDAIETRMALADPRRGHFEYVEFFHLPWLWNPDLRRVLMIGLGGGSIQRAYEQDYPEVVVETAELDPLVIRVAQRFFNVTPTPRQIIHNEDGRVFVRRATTPYDAIIVDAYTHGRYGSHIPYHLATKEFFALAASKLTTNGVIAYNVVGTVTGQEAGLVSTLAQTMAAVFPQVYLFPARESQNVVLIATKAEQRWSRVELLHQARRLFQRGILKLPTLGTRVSALVEPAPDWKANAKPLTDDHAPIDGLLGPPVR